MAGGGVAELNAVAEIDAEARFRSVVRVSDPGSGEVKRRSGNAAWPGGGAAELDAVAEIDAESRREAEK